ENFNSTGQWRNTDGGSPIDASGTFVDGTKFNGPAELRAALVKYRDAYYANVAQKLLGYALGRKARAWNVYDYEMPSVRAIVREASGNDYRWSSIILGIVKSTPFQMTTIGLQRKRTAAGRRGHARVGPRKWRGSQAAEHVAAFVIDPRR